MGRQTTLVSRMPSHSPSVGADPSFDGIICMGGGDWWYHNRGHYDMRMMTELSARLPVLYVNSIGVRIPRLTEGRMFFTRVRRKLKSLRRGFRQVNERFAVFTPFAVPGRLGVAVSRRLLASQVARAGRRIGIRRPLVWVTCPPGAEVVRRLNPPAVVYQRTDRWEAFPSADAEQIKRYDAFLKSRADVTLYCSTLLFEEEADQCRHGLYLDHGVDFDRFAAAGRAENGAPSDVDALPRPRVGFIGGIDDHTFDPPLFANVAQELSDVQFFLVGACSLPEGWCELPNVHLLGQRPYEDVPQYMAAADVLIMPWNQSEWIQACNPVKLKEYLAVARPIVTTSFYELRNYDGLVSVARDAGEFAQAIRAGLASRIDPELQRRRVEKETWSAKCDRLLDFFTSANLT